MPKQEDFIRGNENLKRPNVSHLVSEDQRHEYIEEIIKCREDIVYFTEKYFTIISPAKGKHLIKLYPKQKELLRTMVDKNRVVTLASRQVGKCGFRDTKVKIKNKKTGKIDVISLEKFHELTKNQK